MARRFIQVLALMLGVVPVAAWADGVDFTVPAHYFENAVRLNGPTGMERTWGRSDGAAHSVVVSNAPFSGDLGAAVDELLKAVKGRGGVDVSRADGDPLCGAPSLRVHYGYPGKLQYDYRYVVLHGRLMIASYAHPMGAADDPAAIASLATLCSGAYQSAGPPGWKIMPLYPPNGSAWETPDGSLYSITARAATTGANPADEPYSGRIPATADRREACGTATIHRMTVTAKAPNGKENTTEYAIGTVRGWNYWSTYTRPAAVAADPAALTELTAFCADTTQ